jgi:chorismate mutase
MRRHRNPEGRVSAEVAIAEVTEIERLRAEVKRITTELEEAIEERDRLGQENSQYEVDAEKHHEVSRAERDALVHARQVLLGTDCDDSFTRTMTERAVDALTEIIGYP